MSKTKVFVCKKCKRADCLLPILNKTDAKVVLVGCQKICSGPVVGTKVAGRMEWFSRVDTRKRIAGLRLLLQRKGQRPMQALENRRVPRYSGRAPR